MSWSQSIRATIKADEERLGSIQGRLQVPVWAILLNVFFCGALTLILLGSETALNVFLNCTGTFALVVYGTS